MRQPKQKALAPLLSLQKLSRESSSIASLIKLANSRQSLDDSLNRCLPAPLKGHFKVNDINNQILTLTCSSAKLMTRFRFMQDDIVSQLNTLIAPKTIHMVQIKVRPNIQFKPEQNKPKAISRHISKKNAQILLEEAEHTEDQNLKNILTSLAKHADQ
tara:strand:+ start:481 stop:954 length:474 start_codon:yes stop_codon:yes gene_type:complete